MIRRYLGLLAVLTAVRLLARLIAVAAGAALVVAAAPVSLVAAYAVAHAWIAGWPPRRLYRTALWCLPMVAVWAALTASAARSWWQLAAAPYLAWLAMWHLAAAGAVVPAALTIVFVATPLGRLRPAAMAASGPQCPGQDRRPRCGAAAFPWRSRRGRCRHPGGWPSRVAARGDPVSAAALPPGRDRHHRNRQAEGSSVALLSHVRNAAVRGRLHKDQRRTDRDQRQHL
jgi:hypothetical protein